MQTDTLLYGNTSYLKNDVITQMVEGGRICVCGEDETKSIKNRIRRVKCSSDSRKFDRLLSTYDFGKAIYVARKLTYQRAAEKELEDFRRFLHICRRHELKKILCIMPSDLVNRKKDSMKLEMKFAEDICDYYRESSQMDIKIVYSPCFVDATIKEDYFYQMFHELESGKNWEIQEQESKPVNFIDLDDLADLVFRILENWELVPNRMDLPAHSEYTYGSLAQALREMYPKSEIICSRKEDVFFELEYQVKDFLGWTPQKDAFASLTTMRDGYRKVAAEKINLIQRGVEWFTSNSKLVVGMELLLGTAGVEFLNRILDNNAQFRVIDVRLLFVVMMSSIYGVNIGLMAAVLMCFSLSIAYTKQGITNTMLFYSPENWLPFIMLLVISAICGYLKEKSQSDADLIQDELEQTENEKEFTEELYQETLEHKNEYKRNLIQSRDGFGRIFDVVQRLNNMEPSKIYQESISVMEDILDTQTVAIYTLSEKNQYYARLEVSSARLQGQMERSLKLEDYQDIIDVVRRGEIWANRELREDRPAYVASIVNDDKLRLLLVIQRASFDQMTAYYENLIRIVAGLITNFMMIAWDYQKALWDESHIPETNIVKEDYFEEELRILHDTAHQDMISFVLIKISGAGHTAYEISNTLTRALRDTDMIGAGEDGNYYVLAKQVDKNAEDIILERFSELGLEAKIIMDDVADSGKNDGKSREGGNV